MKLDVSVVFNASYVAHGIRLLIYVLYNLKACGGFRLPLTTRATLLHKHLVCVVVEVALVLRQMAHNGCKHVLWRVLYNI